MPDDGANDKADEMLRLKSALWYSIGNTIDAISLEDDINADSHFIGALTELVWNQIETASQDLEAFAKHARRSTIDVDDVLLLVRKNEDMQALMKQAAEDAKG